MHRVKIGRSHMSFSAADSILTLATKGGRRALMCKHLAFGYYFNQIMVE